MFRKAMLATAIASACAIGLIIWQWSAFFALDSASRASWIQAVGSILAIVASTGVALWVDQGSAARISADRKREEQIIRFAVGKVLLDTAEAMETFSTKCRGQTLHASKVDQELWGLNTARQIMHGMLSQNIPADLVEVLVRSKAALDIYISNATPHLRPEDTAQHVIFEDDLVENTKIATEALRIIVEKYQLTPA